jgi:VacB/RNase II family 3'-5' exoribonuclease
MNRLQIIARQLMRARGLEPDFSPAVLGETRAIAGAATADEPRVRDLRALPWASIDNDTSRDLDQLSVAEALPDRAIKVLVAVADVAAVVGRGSAIDHHAATNTTSVYTAAGVFSMLPERLSTDLTSLGPGVDRLAVVVELVVGADGDISRSDVYRATVRNHAKLAYGAVGAWLEGTAPAPEALTRVPGLDAQMRLQDQVAAILRGRREQQGALNLQTPQAEAVFEGDQLRDLRPDLPNRAKQLIEDLMVAANGVTARYLERRGYPALRRVLRSPARWERIVVLAAGLGESLPARPDGQALGAFLTRRRRADPLRFPELSLSVVKLLGRGEYVLERPGQAPEGHFGLAVTDYTHSTAPNRRFPDLVTQRLLRAALGTGGGGSPYTDAELGDLAGHCTIQEVNAAKVERQVGKSAAAMLLSTRIGERFEGIVTGASDKGTWVRIARPLTEGRVVRGVEGLDVGDRVGVELVHTDVDRGFIDFVRA